MWSALFPMVALREGYRRGVIWARQRCETRCLLGRGRKRDVCNKDKKTYAAPLLCAK
jgi:hypothetical protein